MKYRLYTFLSLILFVLLSCSNVFPSDIDNGFTLIASREIGSDGDDWMFIDQNDKLSWFRLEVPEGALTETVTIELYLLDDVNHSPSNFTLVSPVIELRPKNLVFEKDITITLPYIDDDSDGLFDNTDINESVLFPAYHDEENLNWAPLEPLIPDSGVNVAAFKTNHLEPFALWTTKEDSNLDSTYLSAMFLIWIDWLNDTSLTEEIAVNQMKSSNLTHVFLHTYSPGEDTVGEGTLECSFDNNDVPESLTTRDLFSLNSFLTLAGDELKVVPVISCFSFFPPDNMDQREHLKEIVNYFLENYPDIDGIMLDFIRYEPENYTVQESMDNINSVTSFIREVKNLCSSSVPVYICVWPHANTYREKLLGQRYADMAAVCDYFCPMLYDADNGSTDDIIDGLRRNLLMKNSLNNFKVIPALTTVGISPEELESQIEGSIKNYSDGISYFSYLNTDDLEWNIIKNKQFDKRD